ncbi:hypothetical protein [Ruania alba]|nr:hypothetical protein [Ruania alba]
MDSADFRHRMLEIQAELTDLDPTAEGTVDRAQELADEIDQLAAEQRERANELAAKAFEAKVARTGVDAPENLTSAVDRLTETSDQRTDETR